MPRFVGYVERRPFLAVVDTEAREIEYVGGLAEIPQAIDELVPVTGGVVVSCGPDVFVLEPDLSGPPRPPTPAQRAELAGALRAGVERTGEVVVWRGTLPPVPRLRHPDVVHWTSYEATLSPDGRTLATGAAFVPWPSETVAALALVEVATGAVRLCEPRYRGFAAGLAWALDGDVVAFGAPFESGRRVLVADVATGAVEALRFRRYPPTPLLDARALPSLAT